MAARVGATLSLGAGAAIATALASALDDQSLKAQAETPAGRQLLDVLQTGAPSQVNRIRDALHGATQQPVHWVDNFANQVLHARVREAVSFARWPAP